MTLTPAREGSFRILFSGGRRHDDPALIGKHLDQAAVGRKKVTLVHGRCNPRNANGDPIAAGGIRNQAMVNRGADQMVAAPVPAESRGTYDCMRRAKAAGIPVDDISQPPIPEGLW